ncbi:FkbM family methyltransferase [Candidatus Protofrankia californiensis]|uniref:FkbM family methyltransferase n=1 Tax=Candidatus Protofrankia californiensis TaxID=1839754 RepID=A0A1C3NXK1_9ACTN|nr:FkbM family methyltransferase [Candidatus Protofrankia californiensis]
MSETRRSAVTRLTPRSIAERASHRMVLRRRLPAPFDQTKIYVSSEAGLKYLQPRLNDVDPVLLGLAHELVPVSGAIWDIGANTGLFTFASATAAGPGGAVLAVEPDAVMVNLLRRSSGLPGSRATIDVLPAAVTAVTGVTRFCIASRNRATNHLEGFGSSQTGGIRAVQVVPTVTLDLLLEHFAAPDILKIDVEGAEHLVLEGAERLLSDIRPTIVCEVAAENSVAITAILAKHGYQIFDASQTTRTRRPVAIAPWATLAVPGKQPGPPSSSNKNMNDFGISRREP